MKKVYKHLCVLPVAGLVLMAGCVNPAPPRNIFNIPAEQPATGGVYSTQDGDIDLYTPYVDYDPNEVSFSTRALNLMAQLYRVSGSPVRVALVTTDPNFKPPMWNECHPTFDFYSCQYQLVTTAQNPDIIVRIEAGSWDEAYTTSGFEPVHTRLGFDGLSAPYTHNAWRQIELSTSWKTQLPFYFADDQQPTGARLAIAGHLRGLNFYHQDLYELLATNINARSPDHVFLLGDLTRSNREEEYVEIKHHLLDNLSAPAYYLAGNHEGKNKRYLFETVANGFPNGYVDKYLFYTIDIHDTNDVSGLTEVFDSDGHSAWVKRDGSGLTPRPGLIATGHENLILLDSAHIDETLEGIQLKLSNIASDPSYNANLPTIILSHHKLWDEDWLPNENSVKPNWWGRNFMPFISGVDYDGNPAPQITQVDALIDGDAELEMHRRLLGDWSNIDTFSVGAPMNGDQSSLYFAIATIGSDREMRTRAFYLDLPAGHSFYTHTQAIVDGTAIQTPTDTTPTDKLEALNFAQ